MVNKISSKWIQKQIKYVGEFKNGLFHGKGTYTYSNKEVYSGEFKNGKKIKN